MRRLFVLVMALLLVPTICTAAGTDCPNLSSLQKAAGYISWMGFVKTLGIGAISIGLLFIFWGVVKTILSMTGLMEVLLWSIIIGLLVGTYFVDPTYQTWTLAIGSMLIPGGCLLSSYLHKIVIEETKSLFALTVIWGVLALTFQSSFVGFLTIGALLAFLGFSMVVTPFCHAFGFTSEEALPRATTAGLLIMSLYVASRIAHVELHQFIVFETGALWLASFVGFLGLLITSSRWYDQKKRYLPMNLLALTIMVGVASIGMLYGIKEITTIAGAFLLFYFSEKIIEVETEGFITLGIKLLVVGLMIAGVWQYLRLNEDLVLRFLSI